jgi:uncharacterized protein
MKFSSVVRSRHIILKKFSSPGVSAVDDSPPVPGESRSWIAGWLSVFLLLLLLMSPLHAETAPVVVEAGRPAIQWHEWGQEAFRRAQTEDKLILLDLTAVWCHACHVMDRTTYANPRIIQLLNANFIAIRVDTDQRPDLEARYRAGGWPTTNLLLPTGEILFQANALEIEEMEEILHQVQSVYVTDKATLLKQSSRLWNRVQEKVEPSPFRENAIQVSMIEQSVEIMKKQFDVVHGGFRDAPKFFEPDAIQMAFAYGFFEQDPALIKMGLDTLEKQMPLLDPVWGGFYRYAEQSDWSQPHFEKMLTVQAQNLRNYVEAFQLTGDPQFKRIALALIEYVSRFLTDPQTGLFYESQDADVLGAEEGFFVTGADYYALSESKRLTIGIPRVDQRVFTGSNALMASAYLHASPVLEKPEIREAALQALNRLFEKRFDAKRGLAHGKMEGVHSLYGLLSDHILFGQALVEAFSATGQPQFLQSAEALAEVSRQLLQDPVHGGFFDHPRMSDILGLLRLPTKPVTENFRAVLWYLTLFHLTGKQEYRSIAEGTLQSMVTSLELLPIALAGLAIDQWFRIPVHIAVVGIPGDPRANALLLEARRLYCPGKIVRGYDPQEGQPKWGEIVFPFDGRPVAFVCTDRICSAPVFQEGVIKDSIAEILAVLKEPVHSQ